MAAPDTPADLVKVLREAFAKTISDREYVAEAEKRKLEVELTKGEELEKLAKEIIVQPPVVIEKMKMLLGN